MKLKDILLKEGSYYQFRNETKTRTKSEQLNKAVKEIKKRITEVNKLVDYTNRLKNEINEQSSDVKYWKATNNSLTKISEAMLQITNKIKNLIQ